MGLTFKENCSDTRNSLIIDVSKMLTEKSIKIDAIDPWINDIETISKILI